MARRQSDRQAAPEQDHDDGDDNVTHAGAETAGQQQVHFTISQHTFRRNEEWGAQPQRPRLVQQRPIHTTHTRTNLHTPPFCYPKLTFETTITTTIKKINRRQQAGPHLHQYPFDLVEVVLVHVSGQRIPRPHRPLPKELHHRHLAGVVLGNRDLCSKRGRKGGG